ncbi:MAG TPA: aminotransferase, partial [Clostridia bacterium]
MSEYISLDKAQLSALLASLNDEYQEFKNRKINISMARGIPCNEQLDLTTQMLSYSDYLTSNGTDCRNYGMVDGIPEAKELFSKYLGVNTNEIIIGGNSSLNMMYDTIARFMSFGVNEKSEPWGRQKIKFLCPSPGYDRHFAICELFGIEMIVIPMN